jgi:hypothetical protein
MRDRQILEDNSSRAKKMKSTRNVLGIFPLKNEDIDSK